MNILEFKLWREGKKVNFQLLKQDLSVSAIAVRQSYEPLDINADWSAAPMLDLDEIVLLAPKYCDAGDQTSDVENLHLRSERSAIAYLQDVLESLGKLGTPDYEIADNTDPSKVFRVRDKGEQGG